MRRWAALALLFTLGGRARAESGLLMRAEELLRRAQLERDAGARYALADQAQALCERASSDEPRDPRAHLDLAQALSIADLAHPEACRPGACERATGELKRARELDPSGVEAERIASELGIVYSRLGAFSDALAEYDRALKLVASERSTQTWETRGKSVLYGNSAETLMALGRLDQAIARYRQAEAHSQPGDEEWLLAQWGLGVALDRDEQIEKARTNIERALEKDPTMVHLSDASVFFEPPGDKFYYLALGHEVAGDRDQAIEAWRSYLAAQPNARYGGRARAHLARLDAQRLSRDPGPERARVHVGEPVRPHAIRPVDELRQVLRAAEPELRLCYERSLRAASGLRGEIELAIDVGPDGWLATRPRVFDASFNLESAPLVQCVELTATAWRFVPIETREVETVVVPLHFGPFR